MRQPNRAHRRHFLRTGAWALAGSWCLPGLLSADETSGSTAAFAAFDEEISRFMNDRQIPGGALAVVKDLRLVYARGYGWADREAREPVQPRSLFRIASISKPITAAAVLKLVAAGKVELDVPIFPLLGLEPGADARLRKVTVRQCLHHTGGWDRGVSGDPMFRSVSIARSEGVEPPARQDAIIRYMLKQALDFAPGERYAYSNFGYCVLGRLIEKLCGKPYDQFVRSALLEPAGIRRMHLGASLEVQRAEGEVKYYVPHDRLAESVFPNAKTKVPLPYGSFCLEAMDAHGGWIASAVELARFAATLDATGPNNCLSPEVRKICYEPPAPPVSRSKDGLLQDHYYGCGWDIRPVGSSGKANYWHNGSLPGTFSILVRRHDGLTWACLFNQRSEDPKLSDHAIDPALHRAASVVRRWPAHDLFSQLLPQHA